MSIPASSDRVNLRRLSRPKTTPRILSNLTVQASKPTNACRIHIAGVFYDFTHPSYQIAVSAESVGKSRQDKNEQTPRGILSSSQKRAERLSKTKSSGQVGKFARRTVITKRKFTPCVPANIASRPAGRSFLGCASRFASPSPPPGSRARLIR